ncbi:MAG: YbaB/EbfC family nucleoid-associated protein [Phycisphaerae bacterium]|nr:YbaB/EbfC family nucleoid-associated protein [Phycisphaerae bacterium]
MFDALKAAGQVAALMKNREAIEGAMARVKARLPDLRAVGSAGSGAVRVTASGDMRIVEVTMDPVMASNLGGEASRQTAQGLIVEASNQALLRARELAAREIQREADAVGLGNLPGLDRLLGG